MNFLNLIEAKRDGQSLNRAQIREIVGSTVSGSVPDYQLAALLMAIFFRGLNASETRDLTFAMRDSGEVLEFPQDDRPLVDKHSTGGVGDKVSLPLAPLLACLGMRVPMISGRGLGITGGTLDKLESIPGFRTGLSKSQIVQQVQEIGCVICGQTDSMVPADKKLYALRDVTATVPSIPLITASILSKKLAESLQALILDVKFGSAAFMTDLPKARELAEAMVKLGNECGVETRALLTRMDAPLGSAAGNWLEVQEAVACLEGNGPEDLRELVVDLSAHLLVQCGLANDLNAARKSASDCLASGKPREKWGAMLAAQGVDLDAFSRALQNAKAPIVLEVKADRSGFLRRADARIIGEVVRDLGGGRLRKEDSIDFMVGVDSIAKPGSEMVAGDLLGRIHASTRAAGERAREKLTGAFSIGEEPLPREELIVEVIGADARA